MAKRREVKKFEQHTRFLVLCEGCTEVWYLEQQLDSTKYKIQKPKNSRTNALKLVNFAIDHYLLKPNNNCNKAYDKIYCVFDRDDKSNSEKQLQKVNALIRENHGSLVRVVSNPCFEIIWLFNFEKISREFNNYDEIEAVLNKHLKLSGGKKYEKKQNCINQICELTNFEDVCHTAKKIYEKLAIDHNNWLKVADGFSEIFKLNSN